MQERIGHIERPCRAGGVVSAEDVGRWIVHADHARLRRDLERQTLLDTSLEELRRLIGIALSRGCAEVRAVPGEMISEASWVTPTVLSRNP